MRKTSTSAGASAVEVRHQGTVWLGSAVGYCFVRVSNSIGSLAACCACFSIGKKGHLAVRLKLELRLRLRLRLRLGRRELAQA